MAEKTQTRRGPLGWVKRHKKLTIFLVIVLVAALVLVNVLGKTDKEVAADGATALLEAGEANGVPLPSGCRMGICRTCLTKLDAGRVRDLTTGEVHGEPGDLIRTCVSAAAGDVHLDA